MTLPQGAENAGLVPVFSWVLISIHMEQELFKKTLKPLGYFKRRFGCSSTDAVPDEVFIPHPTTSLCPSCERGWEIYIEKKYGYKDRPYWRWKCRSCKETWEIKNGNFKPIT